MDNTIIKKYYAVYENWVGRHTHRERIVILLAGWLIIYLLWYFLFEKDVVQKNQQLRQALVTQKHQLAAFETEILDIRAKGQSLKQREKAEEQKLKNNFATQTPMASEKDNDVIIQTLLTPQQNVHFLRLENTPGNPGPDKSPPKNNVQVSFSSDYFATIRYLSELEKLPWCLSWDSLEYKVSNYPDALVVINLHIVNS